MGQIQRGSGEKEINSQKTMKEPALGCGCEPRELRGRQCVGFAWAEETEGRPSEGKSLSKGF